MRPYTGLNLSPMSVDKVGADDYTYSPEQHWSLMPFHAICSTVKPASYFYGSGLHYGGPNGMSFPQ